MRSAKNSPASPTIPGVAVCQKAISTHPSVRVNLAEAFAQLRGAAAVAEWGQLYRASELYAKAATALPSLALRFDLGAVFTLAICACFPAKCWRRDRTCRPFSKIMDKNVKDPFVRNWLNLLCFLLSGLPADGTIAAEVAFMFADWYRPNAVLDYPIGGSAALVNALVRGLERHGGRLLLNSHVAEVLVENNRAVQASGCDRAKLFDRTKPSSPTHPFGIP